MMRVIFIVILASFSMSLTGQQQSLYTQFMFNKQAFNPGYTGTYDRPFLTGIHRSQWIGLEGAPTTQHLSFSLPFNTQRFALGLNLNVNTIGITQKTTIEGLYAYKMPMYDGILSIGAQVSTRFFSIDFTDPRLMTIDPFEMDEALEFERRNKILINFGLGGYFEADNYYIGLSIPRLLLNDLDFDEALNSSNERWHFYLMGGYVLPISKNVELVPQLLLRYVHAVPLDLDVNISAKLLKRYSAGLSYRLGGDHSSFGESIDFMFGFQLTPEFSFGFAYDITLSGLREYQSGSVELMVSYQFLKRKKSRNFVNPRYF